VRDAARLGVVRITYQDILSARIDRDVGQAIKARLNDLNLDWH
jgi:hypothetical protein